MKRKVQTGRSRRPRTPAANATRPPVTQASAAGHGKPRRAAALPALGAQRQRLVALFAARYRARIASVNALAALLDEPIQGYEHEARLSADDVGVAAEIAAEALVALRWAVLLRDPALLEPLAKWAEKALRSDAVRGAERMANESVNRQLAAQGVEARIDVEAPERLRNPREWRAEQIRIVSRLESTEPRAEVFAEKVANVLTVNFVKFCGGTTTVVPPDLYERVRRKIELTLLLKRNAPENLVDAAMRLLGVPPQEVKNLGGTPRVRRWREKKRGGAG